MNDKEFNKLYQYTQSRKVSPKDKFLQFLKKKMQTIMIGGVAEFEKSFGDIWGHNTETYGHTDEQIDNAAIWRICRRIIMDIGNAQINAVEKEIEHYNITVK